MNTQTFTQMVSSMATAVQSRATALTNFTAGSVLRAVTEAIASVALWLQNLVVQALGFARASTSNGSDLDSWMADFGITRLQAVFTSGNVTFTRFTAKGPASIPVGSQVQTADGAQTYIVYGDAGNPAYSQSPTFAGYVMDSTTTSLTVPVIAKVAGRAGNVPKETVTVIYQAIPGVDRVENQDAIMHGVDAETDAALRARFVLYINSLSKGTKSAIEAAIAGVQAGLTYTVNENVNSAGGEDDGYFFAVVDDGSGDPSEDLLTAVKAAIENVRGICTDRYGVFPPQVLEVKVSFRVAVVSGYDSGAVKFYAQSAVQSLMANLGVGDALLATSIANAAYTAPGVLGVTDVVITKSSDNTTYSDLQAAVTQKIKLKEITVNYP